MVALPGLPEEMSDDSDDEVAGGESHEEMTYRRKYQMLLERCEVLQQDNERLINRIQHAYKYTRQIRVERAFLVKRLEGYNDNWRHAINQYLLDSLNRPTKIKNQSSQQLPGQVEKEKPFRRPSYTKKPKKEKETTYRRKVEPNN